MNFLAKVVKKNVRHFKVWLGPLSFRKILLKTAQLFSKHFSRGLSLCILYFPIFFCFRKCFNNFHLKLGSNLLKKIVLFASLKSPLKMVKNAFYLMLKAFLFLRFYHYFLVMYKNGLIRKIRLGSKFMPSQPG